MSIEKIAARIAKRIASDPDLFTIPLRIDSKWEHTPEMELEVSYWYDPGQPQSWEDPGVDPTIDWNQVIWESERGKLTMDISNPNNVKAFENFVRHNSAPGSNTVNFQMKDLEEAAHLNYWGENEKVIEDARDILDEQRASR